MARVHAQEVAVSMPPLITREEALALGEITAPGEIGVRVQRAWRARVERFAASTAGR